ncbi:MAG: DUF1254 domain-containing protein [Mycobacterium sp.]
MSAGGWVRAGALAAGVAAALIAGPGVASADDGTDRGDERSSARTATARPAGPARGERAAQPRRAVRPAAGRPAASHRRPPGAATESVDAPVPARAARPAAPAATRPPGPVRSAVLAAQAYIYGFPLMEYQRVRQTVATLNTLYSLTSFANPDVDPVWKAIGDRKRPNVDTFYSLAELDLSRGPVVLSIPDMGSRYFSFQLTDPYTNVSGYIGSRTTGSGPGSYAITWAGGQQADIPGAQTVLVPYSSMMMLGRTLAGDEPDQQSAIELMKQYTLDPTGGTVDPVVPIPRPGIRYLDSISAAMELNPPPAVDEARVESMARIGVGPGLRVADADLGLVSMVAVDLATRAAAALLPLLTAVNQYTAALLHRGWATPNPAIGDYGTDYLLRAGVAEVGLLANTPEEAVYSAGLLSRNLLALRGGAVLPYVLHFGPGEEPPVDAFWSVTVYDAAGRLVPNAENRHSVSSSRPAELARRPDGSVDIVFSPRDPGDPGANWLKVPWIGRFSAYLRMYSPGQPVLDGAWTAPPITRRP